MSADVMDRIEAQAEELADAIAALPLAERVEALNRVRLSLHAVSPFASEPVDYVVWLPGERVDANEWNPNVVAEPEFIALGHSMRRYGITMPIVGNRRAATSRYRIDDGFHRHMVIRFDPTVRERVHGYMPLSLLKGDFTEADEMSATILHNQARGRHQVLKEVEIVGALDRAGWTAEQIAVGTVKSDEELVRMRQVGGVAANLASTKFGRGWTF